MKLFGFVSAKYVLLTWLIISPSASRSSLFLGLTASRWTRQVRLRVYHSLLSFPSIYVIPVYAVTKAFGNPISLADESESCCLVTSATVTNRAAVATKPFAKGKLQAWISWKLIADTTTLCRLLFRGVFYVYLMFSPRTVAITVSA